MRQQLRNIINIFHYILSFRSLQFRQSYSEEYKVSWRKLCLQENFVHFTVALPEIVNIRKRPKFTNGAEWRKVPFEKLYANSLACGPQKRIYDGKSDLFLLR